MNDSQIRNILLSDIKKRYRSTYKIKNLIVQEMVLCKGFARIDIALVNGSMHGFEIKSSDDTLVRLNNQIDYYSKCFDYLSIVASEKHISSLLSGCPQWIGITVAHELRKGIKLEKIRSAKKNMNLEIIALMQLLWKEELISIANQMKVNEKLSYLSKTRIIDHLAQSVKKKLLHQKVRDILKERTTWSTAEFV